MTMIVGMDVSKEDVLKALHGVRDPELKRDLVTLNMVQRVEVAPGPDPGSPARVIVEFKLPQRAGRFKQRFRDEAEAALRDLGVEPELSFSIALSTPERPSAPSSPGSRSGVAGGGEASGGNPLPRVKRIIAVGAGKGGVGKSTLAVNLAVGLARSEGAGGGGRGKLKVGLLDGDIYGPSLPTMIGTDRFEARTAGKMLIPFEVHGVKAMTLGALVEEDKPLIWRGPMAHGAFKQLATQTDWGALDYLIIDLPPGTGDVPLTMSQLLPLTGAVVVCTPQKVAQDDAKRAIAMFRSLGVDVLGLVENMSYFIGDDGKEYDLFGRGGAEMLAQRTGVPFLGAVPINMNLRRNGDAGDPTANFTNDDTLAAELGAVVRALRDQVTVHEADPENALPVLTVR